MFKSLNFYIKALIIFALSSLFFAFSTLWYFSIGLPAFSLIKIFSSFLFARNNTKIPFYFSLVSVILNILISVLFFKKFGFSKASILSGIFLALILCSWYSIRSIRNEMAVQNVDSLPWLLMAAAIVMFLMNPIYSWVASRSNLKKILTMYLYYYDCLI